MMIDIDLAALDGIVRAWIKDNLKEWQTSLDGGYVHPEDEKMYRKDIKAMQRILDYIGDDT